MLREADEKDKLVWVRLNKEFMNFEIQDGDLWNHVNEAKDEELGDVFFNLIFIAKCFEEENEFTIDQVLNEVCEKLIRRHPHIFENASETNRSTKIQSASDVKAQWDKIKDNVEESNECIWKGRELYKILIIQMVNGEIKMARQKKKEIVEEWQQLHPNGKKSECIKDTGLSKPTVYKWWRKE